jgi:hypothetical protein
MTRSSERNMTATIHSSEGRINAAVRYSRLEKIADALVLTSIYIIVALSVQCLKLLRRRTRERAC